MWELLKLFVANGVVSKNHGDVALGKVARTEGIEEIILG